MVKELGYNLYRSNANGIAAPSVIHIFHYVRGRRFSIQEMQGELQKFKHYPKLKFENEDVLQVFLGIQMYKVLQILFPRNFRKDMKMKVES